MWTWIPTSTRDGGPLRREDEEEAEAEEEEEEDVGKGKKTISHSMFNALTLIVISAVVVSHRQNIGRQSGNDLKHSDVRAQHACRHVDTSYRRMRPPAFTGSQGTEGPKASSFASTTNTNSPLTASHVIKRVSFSVLPPSRARQVIYPYR